MITSNRISKQLDEYVSYKQSLGFKIKSEIYVLRKFIRYTLSLDYDGPLTKDLVLTWCSLDKSASNKAKGRRFEPISTFAKYITSFDAEAEVMPKCPFGNPHTRTTPYIYTESETKMLMDECSNLYSPDGLRSLTIKTAIGLLWATGLRTSELTNLKIKDVDFNTKILYIWNSKFRKDRIVPISNSVMIELIKYKLEIDKLLGVRNNDAYFFVTTSKKPLDIRSFEYAFIKIRGCINANPIGHPAVRLTDFRHTFACRTILSWLNNGIDANSKLIILSTYLGHVKPQDTYWYLSATPEMLNTVCTRYEKKFGGNYNENC